MILYIINDNFCYHKFWIASSCFALLAMTEEGNWFGDCRVHGNITLSVIASHLWRSNPLFIFIEKQNNDLF
jgi:hypothetical protein